VAAGFGVRKSETRCCRAETACFCGNFGHGDYGASRGVRRAGIKCACRYHEACGDEIVGSWSGPRLTRCGWCEAWHPSRPPCVCCARDGMCGELYGRSSSSSKHEELQRQPKPAPACMHAQVRVGRARTHARTHCIAIRALGPGGVLGLESRRNLENAGE
jgi:hypothetical protein